MSASIKVLDFENCAVVNNKKNQHDRLLFKAFCSVMLLETVL